MSDDNSNLRAFNKYVGTAEDADAFQQRLIKKDHDRTRKRSGIDAAVLMKIEQGYITKRRISSEIT